jgi:hypothetical protein
MYMLTDDGILKRRAGGGGVEERESMKCVGEIMLTIALWI